MTFKEEYQAICMLWCRWLIAMIAPGGEGKTAYHVFLSVAQSYKSWNKYFGYILKFFCAFGAYWVWTDIYDLLGLQHGTVVLWTLWYMWLCTHTTSWHPLLVRMRKRGGSTCGGESTWHNFRCSNLSLWCAKLLTATTIQNILSICPTFFSGTWWHC